MHDPIAILVSLSACFVLALGFGLLTRRVGLSPIVGYLLAGVVLGPQTPGFVADQATAAQFAEIGVVLLMFGVGLHFHLKDLLNVRRVALTGAAVEIPIATTLAVIAATASGLSFGAGVVYGLAVSVASTVVLVRVLMDNDAFHSGAGHIAVGWLIVEDIFTVLVLVLLPAVAGHLGAEGTAETEHGPMAAIGLAVVKVATLAAIVLLSGRRLVPWLLTQVARSRSRELFTLAILSLALAVATGASAVFGVSLALGAFLAGVVVGQSEVSHQAAADALPMRDAFAVLFFVSVGMLFDPAVVVERPGLLASLIVIVLVVKPLVAIVVVWLLGRSVRTALTVGFGLSQIGEFSFILANTGQRLGILGERGAGPLVACALVAISLNPLVFRFIDPCERWLRARPRLWRILSLRSEARATKTLRMRRPSLTALSKESAIVVGYGPVGRHTARILADFDIEPVVVDLNLDTIRELQSQGRQAIYGDATRRDVLQAAGLEEAGHLLLTTPDVPTNTAIALAAKAVNPRIKILVRTRYLRDRDWLKRTGAEVVACEEAEVAIGLMTQILLEVGADDARIEAEIRHVRGDLADLGRQPQES